MFKKRAKKVIQQDQEEQSQNVENQKLKNKKKQNNIQLEQEDEEEDGLFFGSAQPRIMQANMNNFQEILSKTQAQEQPKAQSYLQNLKEETQRENQKTQEFIQNKKVEERVQHYYNEEQLSLGDSEKEMEEENNINSKEQKQNGNSHNQSNIEQENDAELDIQEQNGKKINSNGSEVEEEEIQEKKRVKQFEEIKMQLEQEFDSEDDEYTKRKAQDSKKIREEKRKTAQDQFTSSDQMEKNLIGNLDNKRYAMIGEVKPGFTGKNNPNDYVQELVNDDFSDEEFQALEGALINQATKSSNYNQKFGKQDKLKAIKQAHKLYTFENASLDVTLDLVEQNLLTAQAQKTKIEKKIETYIGSTESSDRLIRKWKNNFIEEEKEFSSLSEQLEFWTEYKDMLDEKAVEVDNAYFQMREIDNNFCKFKQEYYRQYFNESIKVFGGEPIAKVVEGSSIMQEETISQFKKNKFQIKLNKKRTDQGENSGKDIQQQQQTLEEGYSSDSSGYCEDEVEFNAGPSEQEQEKNHFPNLKVALFSAALEIFQDVSEEFLDLDYLLLNCKQFATLISDSNKNNESKVPESKNYLQIYYESIESICKGDILGYDPLCFAAQEMQYYNIQDFKEISVIQKLIEQKEYEVCKMLVENYIFERLVDQIELLYYPFSEKQTQNLKISVLHYIDFCYKNPYLEKKPESLTKITQMLEKILKKFIQILPFATNLPLFIQETQQPVQHWKRNTNKHLKLFSNIVFLGDILPLSNVVSIAINKILQGKIFNFLPFLSLEDQIKISSQEQGIDSSDILNKIFKLIKL